MEVGCDVVAHESEEAGYHVGFVAGANELEVDGLLVEEETEEGDYRVDGYHCEDSDDAAESVCGLRCGGKLTASAHKASSSEVHDRAPASQRCRSRGT
jgi:hypothetical protein